MMNLEKQTSKIFVTGANGLLGANVIRELIDQEVEVIALVRNKKTYQGLMNKRLKLIEGDLRNVSSYIKELSSCSFVIHCAALTQQNLIDYNAYYQVNVLGFQNLIEASVKAQVKRIVHVGTASIIGYGTRYNLGSEEADIKFPFSSSLYARSKKQAHDLIQCYKDEIDLVEVNPTFMIGPMDSKPSSGKIILMGMKKRFVFCPSGGKNFVCVRDVAKGAIKAMERGVNGESYLLANENLSFYEFYKLVRVQLDGKLTIIKLPDVFVGILGRLGSLFRKFNIKTNLSKENMKVLCTETYYSNRKAVSELQMTFTPIEEGIREAIDWFETNLV